MTHFSWLDGGIVGLYLLVTMVAGVAVRKYVGKVEHFLLAGREMEGFQRQLRHWLPPTGLSCLGPSALDAWSHRKTLTTQDRTRQKPIPAVF